MSKVLITTVPFGQIDKSPLELLSSNNIEYLINPLGRKIQTHELADLIADFDVVIAGTEKIDKSVLDRATKLKLISRVGVGLDSVDLLECKKAGVQVSYTPDAPAPAVAELTLGLMLSCLRHIGRANIDARSGIWKRHFGRRLSEITVGIIGTGRIGARVISHLHHGFGISKILANDVSPVNYFTQRIGRAPVEWVSKDQIYRQADVISLHVPLTPLTHNMITIDEMMIMKKDAILINTSRGGIVNEDDLFSVLCSTHLSSVALDVFEKEPYDGILRFPDRCFLTSHMGSMSVDCRSKMEIQATSEAVRFLLGEQCLSPVPEEEYIMRSGSKQ